MTCHITVLGDSSSSGIGLGRACYPANLARILRDRLEVHIFNCAVPGFTSADANRFFHNVAAKRPLDYLIVYLGNNEGAASYQKKHFSTLKAWLADRLSRQPGRHFRPVLSPPRFRFNYEMPAQTAAVTPAEFRDNLRSIVRCATKRSAQTIILNPVANRRFPCGLGITNSTYFCRLDHLDRLGEAVVNEPIDDASETLTAGLRYYRRSQFAEAIKVWESLVSMENVAGFIARHNIACARAQLADDASESQLRALLGEYDSYDSTVLYNLSILTRWQGYPDAADQLLEAAIEKDTSVYRIQQAYRDVINEFASMSGVRVLDMKPILKPFHFIDYCHPTEEGHEEIARAVADLIRPNVQPRCLQEGSSYETYFPTPNYKYKLGQTLLDYYCIDWPIQEGRIAAAIATKGHSVKDMNSDDFDGEINKCVANFFHSNSQHPVFTDNLNLLGAWSPRSHEILSFPEQFLYRVLYNYSAAFENDGLAKCLSAASILEQVRFSAADYKQIILRKTHDNLDTELDITRVYFDAILNKIKHQLLSDNLIYRVAIGQRICTVMTWFTREAFRYGTQSRMSMLYARWDIEKIIEGLIVAIVIANKRGEEPALVKLDQLLSQILSLLQAHEHHVQLYHRDAMSFSVDKYMIDLASIERTIKAQIDA